MQFISVESTKGEVVYINKAHVAAFGPMYTDGAAVVGQTVVVMSNGSIIYVKSSSEDLAAMLN